MNRFFSLSNSSSVAIVPPPRVADAEADGAVDEDAAEKVEDEPKVESEGLVLEGPAEAGIEDQKIDRVPGEDRDGVFNPSTRRHEGKDLPRGHGRILGAFGPAKQPLR
jgi:hypothetical protein